MLKKMELGGVLLASLLTATGCQNEEIVSNEQQKGNYSLKVSSLVDSRTYVEGDGTVKWSEGDKMYVYGEGVSGILTLKDDDKDKTSGTFSGFVFGNPDNLKWAVFGDNVKGTADGAQFTISSITDPNSNSPMVGEIKDGNVQMEHLCGMVRITINNLPEGAEIILKGTDIAGTATVVDGKTTVTTPSNDITINVTDDDPTIEVPVFVAADETSKTFTLTVNDTNVDDAVYTFSTPVAVGSLSEKAILALTCKLDDAGKEVIGFNMAATTEESLQQAINAGGTILLGADITLTKTLTVPEGVTVTLDLSGNTINNTSGNVIVNNGTLTVTGGTVSAIAAYAINNKGTLTIDEAMVDGGISNAGVLTVESGKVYTTRGGYAHAFYHTGTSLTINGGEFSGNGNEVISDQSSTNSTVVINGGIFDKVEKASYLIRDTKNTLVINGGTFYAYDESGTDPASQHVIGATIYGGTFNYDPTNKGLASGYSAITNSDGTYTVLEGNVVVTNNDGLKAAIETGQTNIALAAGEYTLPNVIGKDITLVGVGPETIVDYSHMGNYQEVSGSSFIFKNMTVKNAEAGYPYKGLQHTTSVSYENCHITGTVNLFAPATFTDCTFDSKNAEHNVVTYGSDDVTFTGCEFTYGDRAVNCYAENASDRNVKVTFTNCEFTKVNGMDTTGAIETNSCFMSSLTVTINNCTVNEGKLWFVAGWDSLGGSKTTVTVNGVSSESAIIVQSGVLPYLKLNSNSTYMLEGDFESKNVSVVMPVGVENVVFDGTNATNINELIILQNGTIIDNANDVVGERSGNVTVQNFNVLSQINVFACKTEVVVQNNSAEALMIHAGNCAVKVLNNTIDANFESHLTYKNATDSWNTNKYGIALNIFEYNLWFEGNTVTDAMSHAIGINGWESTFDTGKDNKIESFTGNKITVNVTNDTKRSAFKVWDDETYASNDDDTNVVNATAQAFIDAVLADNSNTFNIMEGYDHTIFCFYNVNTNK